MKGVLRSNFEQKSSKREECVCVFIEKVDACKMLLSNQLLQNNGLPSINKFQWAGFQYSKDFLLFAIVSIFLRTEGWKIVDI